MFSIGFPSGALAGVGPVEALLIFRDNGISSPEIHARYPGDVLFSMGRELFGDASIYLPSTFHTDEQEALILAREAVGHGYHRLIIHPYVIKTPRLWQELGPALVFENMDFRSPGFMAVADMQQIFKRLPEASFCLDVGHTYSWDHTEAARLIEALSDRLVCVHYSEVNRTNGDHLSAVSDEVMRSHAEYMKLLSKPVAVVLEVDGCTLPQLLDLRARFFESLAGNKEPVF